MNCHVLHAVFRRNFVSYFANPTGYLFICAFVILCALAAFWPPSFFNDNLANLDQLTWAFPLIMLVFIPSITMGVWADERRQGTDELLLTIPASDFDVVLGKYLAAVLIYTVSLLFSLLCNFLVLSWLGSPDPGLFISTYFGYWLVGLTMLAIGMVASFVTGNLTVSYILGVVFNAPLVFTAWAPILPIPEHLTAAIKHCSLGDHLAEFGRGVIGLSSVVYFAALAAVMLYVCMVLIGRRHWHSGRGGSMAAHYCVRIVALAAIAAGATFFLQNHDARYDATAERINSLAPETKELLTEMKFPHPVTIEAFISPDVPESYVQTRLNLLALLREFEALRPGALKIVVHDTKPLSDEAALAEKTYGIEPREVFTRERGMYERKKLFMNLAISCGPDRLPAIFVDRGTPLEYELIRSLGTLAQQERKRIGVLTTDAQVMGRFNPMNPAASEGWPIVKELEKQYEVVSVDPAQPIKEKYDALLAVQPSSLGLEEMKNFIAAVEGGQPTAIFEDPLPFFMPSIAGTELPRRPPGGMQAMFMGQRNLPKGDIRPLWKFLGVNYDGDDIVWQRYNPYPKSSQFTSEFVIVDQGEFAGKREAELPVDKEQREKIQKQAAAGRWAFNPDNPISAGLQQVLFIYPGSVLKRNVSDFEFIPLAETGTRTGFVNVRDIFRMSPFGQPQGLNENARKIPTGIEYVMGAEIRGKISPLPPGEGPGVRADSPQDGPNPLPKGEGTDAKPKDIAVHVVMVPDIDLLAQDFFLLREMGSDNPLLEVNYSFNNVTFVLNILDVLAGGDTRFITIRNHRPEHRTLTCVEQEADLKNREVAKAREDSKRKFQEDEDSCRKIMQKKIDELRSRKDTMDPLQLATEVALLTQTEESKLEQRTKANRRELDKIIVKSETDLERTKKKIRDRYKLLAVLLPPIPPLLIGIAVYLTRRSREREGVDRARLQ